MTEETAKGNNPQLWDKLLAELDEKLQLGLLDKVKRVKAYHFESDILFLEAGTDEDDAYLRKGGTLQHLELIAQDATGIREIRLRDK